MKYQFCIRFDNIDANSAASKAVLDCNKIFSTHGYKDYTFTVGDNSNKLTYYYYLLKELITFFLAVKSKSVVGIQYPLLSINNVFKYFIQIARIKNVKFFCVVHDLESLRTGGKDQNQINLEIANLNYYDTIIVHNTYMQEWLTKAGIKVKMIPLQLFDYLSEDFNTDKNPDAAQSIVYAGNLGKSTFIYALPVITNKHFNVYGPNFKPNQVEAASNVSWAGEYRPDEIPDKLSGAFGLIWDGARIDDCDEILGNYLKYNNPHKCSLYLAAGLPVIAPLSSAIGALIKQLNIGLLINNIYDLEHLDVDEKTYLQMKKNVLAVRRDVITGAYFSTAIKLIENDYAINS